MDSKYNLLGDKTNKFKMKPTPIIFSDKNGQPPSKKPKFSKNESNKTAGVRNEKGAKVSIQEQRKKLPVYEQRFKLLEQIKRHSTLIIIGDTGCGKTTQIPQYIYSARLQENLKIAVTQPRRVAAITIATRVAQELGNGVSI